MLTRQSHQNITGHYDSPGQLELYTAGCILEESHQHADRWWLAPGTLCMGGLNAVPQSIAAHEQMGRNHGLFAPRTMIGYSLHLPQTCLLQALNADDFVAAYLCN